MVEVGGREHECCGPAYQRDTVVELSCRLVPPRDGGTVRYVETRHDAVNQPGTTRVRGRVVDICIQHPDGVTEQIERLPSGRALRGFDNHDDGHLEQPWTGQLVINDSDRYLVTLAS